MAKTIVILGANFTGIPIAHYLLKHTSPKVPGLKVIIVSPNTHMYWHVASVRAILPDMLADEKVFLPIAPAFAKYPSKNYEIVLGKAEKLEPAAKSVHIVTNEGESRVISYDAVVIATGASFREDMPFKTLSSTQETKEKIQEYAKRIGAAKSIVVAGGGFTGVEVAGELGEEYGGKKKITLILDKDLPFSEKYKPDVRETAAKILKQLKVDIVTNAKVSAASTKGPDGPTSLEIAKSNGRTETIQTDLYLPAFGIVPNTQFVPDELLDARGFVNQTVSLRAQGQDDVFVVGDAGNLQAPQGVLADAQAVHVVKGLEAYLAGQPVPEYHPDSKIIFAVSLGKSKGTGQVGNWRPWGFIISYFKSRHLGTDSIAPFVAGAKTVTAKNWA